MFSDGVSIRNPNDPIVFIDRAYGVQQDQSAEWEALLFHAAVVTPIEEAHFADIDAALAWARKRGNSIFVRLGPREDTHYSAGRIHLHERNDGTGAPYPEWPPDNWPDYKGAENEPRRFTPQYALLGSTALEESFEWEATKPQ